VTQKWESQSDSKMYVTNSSPRQNKLACVSVLNVLERTVSANVVGMQDEVTVRPSSS